MSPHRHQLPRYHPKSERLFELGLLWSLLWIPGMVGALCLVSVLHLWQPAPWLPWVLVGLALFPTLLALALALPLWLLARRQGAPTVWRWLDDVFRQVGQRLPARRRAAPTRPATLILGTTDKDRPIRLDSPGLHRHFLVDGKTRQGKSTLLAAIAQQDVARADCAVAVLDPHAGLVDTLLAARLDRLAGDRLVVLLADQDHVPGFNLLQPLPDETPEGCASRLVECAVALWFGGEPAEALRFQNYTHHAAWALAATGWTVLEIEPLLRHRPFRQHIAAQVADPRLRAWLAELDRERDDRIRDLTESTVNRFRKFAQGAPALIFGQQRTTFDLPHLLEAQGVLLAALPAAALGETGAYLAAGVLLGLVDDCLARRPKDSPTHVNPRLRLLADEVQAYAVPQLRRLLAERGGFGASLVLASQGLNQLSDRQLSRFILNNTSMHLAFACGAEEAQILAEELFRPDPLRVKARQEIWVTFYTPQEQMIFWAKEIQHLPPHTFFTRVPGQAPVRGTTRPLPVHRDGTALAAAKDKLARRVGRPRGEVEAELARRRHWIYEGGEAPTMKEGRDGWV